MYFELCNCISLARGSRNWLNMGKRKHQESGDEEDYTKVEVKKEVDNEEDAGILREKKAKKRKHKEKEEEEDGENGEDKGALVKKEEDMEVTVKQEKVEDTSIVQTETEDSRSYEELVTLVSCIAQPLASKKLTKRLYKVVKKAQKAKKLKRGVREVVKGLRKDEKGVVILAGDVSPIDVISHIPVFCEDKGVPYCYVPSRKELGAASLTKRPTSVVLVQQADDYKTLYDTCYSTVDALPLPI